MLARLAWREEAETGSRKNHRHVLAVGLQGRGAGCRILAPGPVLGGITGRAHEDARTIDLSADAAAGNGRYACRRLDWDPVRLGGRDDRRGEGKARSAIAANVGVSLVVVADTLRLLNGGYRKPQPPEGGERVGERMAGGGGVDGH